LFNINLGRIKEEWIDISIPSEPFKQDLKHHPLNNDEKIHANLSILKNKSKINLENKNPLEFKHTIKLETNQNDLSVHENLNLEDPSIQKKLEHEFGKKIKQWYQSLLKDLQDMNSDPLGYGEIYRQNIREKKITEKEWRELYPDIKVNYNIEVNITGHGETF